MAEKRSVPLFPRGLWNVGWRYLLLRRWQSLLMVMGIALGVAVMVAIDLANASASRAFELSTQAITGTAGLTAISASPLQAPLPGAAA